MKVRVFKKEIELDRGHGSPGKATVPPPPSGVGPEGTGGSGDTARWADQGRKERKHRPIGRNDLVPPSCLHRLWGQPKSTRTALCSIPSPGGGEGFAERSSPEPQAPLFRNHHVPGGSIDLSRVSLCLQWSDPPPGPGFWGDHCWMGQNVHGPPPPAPLHMGKMPPVFGWVHCKRRTSWGHPFPIRHPQKREKTQSTEGLPER